MSATPNPIDLTTYQAVENYANVASSSPVDQAIQKYVTGASRYFLLRTGLASLNSVAQYNETYDGNGNSQLFLRQRPIVSVASVMVNAQTIPASTGPTITGWRIHSIPSSIVIYSGGFSGGPATFASLGSAWYGGPYGGGGGRRPYAFAIGQQNVNVIYTAGFTQAIQNELQTIAAGTITLDWDAAPNSFLSDQGVVYVSTGVAFVKVPSAPAVGQYTVNAVGAYGFNTTDNNEEVLVSYTVEGPPPDINEKCTQLAAINYKRQSWIDQASQTLDGTAVTRYRDWEIPPDIERCIQNNMRRSAN